ncbi:MAG: type II toxin-antitoxin system prevent-host-death family antitoxin [Acidobacteria bacterium]|nr:type II toxin-antitoxin system prevent-host-death family antitoxin [Acidobacteriota bacterium]
MERIRIRDLHLKTGEWVRRAAHGEGVVVTERGRPVASLVPHAPDASGRSFRDRRVLPEFDALPSVPGDVVVYVSEDRDRR